MKYIQSYVLFVMWTSFMYALGITKNAGVRVALHFEMFLLKAIFYLLYGPASHTLFTF